MTELGIKPRIFIPNYLVVLLSHSSIFRLYRPTLYLSRSLWGHFILAGPPQI